MPDPVAPIEPTVTAPPEPAAPVAVAAPAVEAAPAATPAPALPPESAPVVAAEAPAAEPAKTEAAPAEAADPHSEPTLLEKFEKEKAEKAEADKAKEPAAPEAPKEAAAVEVPEPPLDPAVVYADLTLPEGVTPDKEALSAYTGLLGKYRVPMEAGQELLDLHTESLKAYAQHVDTNQLDVWNQTRKGWRDAVMADPELGGAGYNTAMELVAKARDQFVPEKERAEFDNFMRYTGSGDNPAYLRALYRAGQYIEKVQQFLREPAASSAPTNIRPPPNHGRTEPRSLRDMYKQTREASGR